MLAEGIAQRFVQRLAGMATLRLTQLGSLAIAATEGEGDEATRAGIRFHMNASGATGIAPVQALPSTAAQWMIYNPQGNPVSAFLDALGISLATGTAGAGGSVLVCPVGPSFAPSTIPTTSAANVKIMNANPVSQKQSQLIVVSGQTLQNAAVGNWSPIGCFMNPAGTILGQTQMDQRDIRGKLVIPPGCGLGICVISPTGTTPLFTPYATWREYTADLE
jgi:hypothetical protein